MIACYKQSCTKLQLKFNSTHYYDIAKLLKCPFCGNQWTYGWSSCDDISCRKCDYDLSFRVRDYSLQQVQHKELFAVLHYKYGTGIAIYKGNINRCRLLKKYHTDEFRLDKLLNHMNFLGNLYKRNSSLDEGVALPRIFK